MDQLNATDSSPCTCHLSSLACLTLVCSDRLPVSLAPALQSSSSPFLSLQTHSVDSSALSYTVRSPPSHLVMFSRSTAQNIKETSARVQFKKVRVPSILFVQSIWIFSIWPHVCTQTDRQTHIHTPSCNAVPLVWGLLRLALINVTYTEPFWNHRDYTSN